VKLPVQTFKLQGPQLIDPGWFNTVRGGRHNATVTPAGTVLVEGVELSLCSTGSGRPDGVVPVPGTAVEVWLEDHFVCATKEELRRASEAAQARLDEQARAERDARNRCRDEADAFNKGLRLPIAWTVGIKDVLSGLADGSWGDGRNRASVNHVLLRQPLSVGRLRRNANDFLCSSNDRLNGKRWAGQPEAAAFDGDGKRYQPKVTCKRCVELALRLSKDHVPEASQGGMTELQVVRVVHLDEAEREADDSPSP